MFREISIARSETLTGWWDVRERSTPNGSWVTIAVVWGHGRAEKVAALLREAVDV